MSDLEAFELTGTNNPLKPISATNWNLLMARLERGIPVTPQDFGALADDVTDDSAAFLAAIAFLETQSITGYGYGDGTGTLFVPAGTYYLGTTTLDIYTAMTIRGEGFGENSGVSTILRWDAGTTGIRVHSTDTSGGSSTRVSDGRTGAGTIIERLLLQGVFSGTEAEAHGIHLRTRASVYETWVANFDGDGLHIYASSGSGGATEGNANDCFVQRSTFAGCRNGMFIQGSDVNAGSFIMVDVIYNRRWGIWDNSFLGNAHFGHVAHANGIVNVGGSIPYTLAVSSGKHYSVVQGQEVAASTNAPSGTTADNAYWYYVRANGITAYSPAWFSGISVRDGGPYFASTSDFTSCYSEADQAVSQFVTTASTSGTSSHYAGAKGNGKHETHYAGGFGVSSGMRLTGNNPAFSGPAGLELYMYGASAKMAGYDRDNSAFLPLTLGGSEIIGTISDATIHTTDANGINLASGKVLKANGTQVVGAQGAAVADPAAITSIAGVNAVAAPTKAEFDALVAVANAIRVDLASVRTQQVALLARLRAATGHGLIA